MSHKFEKVCEDFSLQTYLKVRKEATQVVLSFLEKCKVGQSEFEMLEVLKADLKNAGFDKNWHRPLLRSGANTLLTFSGKSVDREFKTGDVIFADIGPVKDGYEADIGRNIVLGDNEKNQELIKACEEIFFEISKAWQSDKLSGPQIYELGDKLAKSRGYKFFKDVDGHRLGDFPHHVHYRGSLGEFEAIPIENVWVLEVQICDQEQENGAFFEDILLNC